MTIAYHAEHQAETPAVISPHGNRTFEELNHNDRRAPSGGRARRWRFHCRADENRPDFLEALFAAERIACASPINYHLKGDEIGYIVDTARQGVHRRRHAGTCPDQSEHGAQGAAAARGRRCHRVSGRPRHQQYSPSISRTRHPAAACSYVGTTGRPKGVHRNDREPVPPQWEGTLANYHPGQDANLCTGPAYHAAPLLMNLIQPLTSGVTVVMMDRWDPEETLHLIESHRITHTHMVATMFHRLLQLPDDVKARHDISSMRFIIHGAAPTPVHVKRAIIDWFGPIVWEYYAATEGGGGFIVGPEEWLKKPGTVGRPGPGFDNKILDDDGNEAPPGKVGTVYMKGTPGPLEYCRHREDG
jgi:long-chain acyl-CoA synthetase